MFKHKYAKQIFLIGCPGFVLTAIAGSLTLFAFLSGHAMPLPLWLMAAVGISLIVWFGIASHQQHRRWASYQAKRDASASAIRDAVLAGQPPERPFFVYLRPFDIDRKFYAAPSGIPADPTYVEEYGWPTADHDLESVLANIVYTYGLLVALSDQPGEAGVAHIKASVESWREQVRALCTQAVGIFVVPFDFEGTAWEIDLVLKAGWLSKTFFIMPAEQGFARRLGLKSLTSDYRQLWEAGRARYETLNLPAYETQGGILQVTGGEITPYLFGRSRTRPGPAAQAKSEIIVLGARLEELTKEDRTLS